MAAINQGETWDSGTGTRHRSLLPNSAQMGVPLRSQQIRLGRSRASRSSSNRHVRRLVHQTRQEIVAVEMSAAASRPRFSTVAWIRGLSFARRQTRRAMSGCPLEPCGRPRGGVGSLFFCMACSASVCFPPDPSTGLGRTRRVGDRRAVCFESRVRRLLRRRSFRTLSPPADRGGVSARPGPAFDAM